MVPARRLWRCSDGGLANDQAGMILQSTRRIKTQPMRSKESSGWKWMRQIKWRDCKYYRREKDIEITITSRLRDAVLSLGTSGPERWNFWAVNDSI